MLRQYASALAAIEIMASTRHETASLLERCFHWIMFLRQPDAARPMTATEAIGELEAELRLLEEAFRKLGMALDQPTRPARND